MFQGGQQAKPRVTALCSGEVEEYHSLHHVSRSTKMAFMLLVAGTALALFAAALFIIERENAAM
jgi:hypothetical protein